MTNQVPENSRAGIHPKTIAIGGAKGGIGKSFMAANLGVALAGQGKRTVLVDLDLGGANLHLFLGVWSLPRRIDDFLKKRVTRIDEVIVPTKYGVGLIGGGGASLGAANIPFTRKLKLLRALKRIEADYILYDLGGSTTFNILDFYLAADTGLVLTTCDPAAYLDSYNFIKMSLFRKLSRLFGSESAYGKERDVELVNIIKAFIHTAGSGQSSRIDDLLSTVRSYRPEQSAWLEEILAAFRPKLLINMAAQDSNAPELAGRLIKVCRKMLSIEVDFIGALPFLSEVQKSTHKLTPHVARNPQGEMATFCQWLLERLP